MTDTIKFKLTIAYDGTNYAGWQTQKTGLGVQQKIEEAFWKLFPGVKRLHSSSRTDTGVHALGMIAHVEIPRAELKMHPRKLALAINAFCPATSACWPRRAARTIFTRASTPRASSIAT